MLCMTSPESIWEQVNTTGQDSTKGFPINHVTLSDSKRDTSLIIDTVDRRFRCILEPISMPGITITLQSQYTPEGAKKAIANGKPQILYHGGFGGIPDLDTEEAKHFRKKYGVDLYSQGSIRMSDDDEEGYNRIIFQYLDRKFGKAWRYELPDWAVGFEPPVKEYTAAGVTCHVKIPNSDIDTDGKKKFNERIKSNYGQGWLILLSVTIAAGSLAFIWYGKKR